MNYNKGFNYSELFTDKKYRSRLILAIYAIVFIILIAFLRTEIKNGNIDSNSFNEENNNDMIDNNTNNNTDNNTDDNSYIENIFSYINMNNYNFEYTLYYNDDKYISSGKRYDRKYDFDLTNGKQTMHYLVSGPIVKAKNKEDIDASYMTTNLPYSYINYFDNDTLKEILINAKQISVDTYEITNGALAPLIDNRSNFIISDDELVNHIMLEIKNNIVVGIDLDFSNLFFGDSDIFNFKISLKYSNFGLIDNFSVNF